MSDQPQNNAPTTPPVEPAPAPSSPAAAPAGEVDPISGLTPDEMKAAVGAVLDSDKTVPASDAATPAASGEPDEVAAASPAAPADQQHDATHPAGIPRVMPASARPFGEPELSAATTAADLATIELLDDVELDVKVELGRTEMYIEDVLRLGVGSVVELDRAAGDPVDIRVNDRLVARGEVLVLNDSFCVRINEIVSPVPEAPGEGG